MRIGVVIVALLAACSDDPDGAARIAQLESDMTAFDEDLTRTEQRVRSLSESWSELQGEYAGIAERYRRAGQRLAASKASNDVAHEAHERAAADWRSVATSWRFFQQVIQQAAMMDAARSQPGGGPTCESVSTAAYRRVLRARGIDVAGKDIDHIVPHALGGADHPDNYQVLDSSLNRSLGATWDVEKCAMAGDQCARAVAISAKCGTYRGGF